MSTQHTTRDNATPSQKNKPKSNFFSGKGNGFFPTVQAKLTLSQPGDAAEREADAMADKVMRKAATGPVTEPPRVAGNVIPPVQRKCSHCEEEEKKLQRKEEEGEELPVQRKCSHCEAEENHLQRQPANENQPAATTAVAAGIRRYKGQGSPMQPEVQSFMQEQFNADFSKVRIHNGGYAAEMTSAVNAQAFTAGSDIYFNEGKYAPDHHSGQRLLAHELTHVLQQGAGAPLSLSRKAAEDRTEHPAPASLSFPPKTNETTLTTEEPAHPAQMNAAVTVRVPVDQSMEGNNSDLLREALLRTALQSVFPITDEQVDTLVSSGWNWTYWRPVSRQEAAQGFKVVALSQADYQKIMGMAQTPAPGYEQREQARQDQLLDSLENMNRGGEVIRLRQAIKEKRAEQRALSRLNGPNGYYMPVPGVLKLEREIMELEKQLDAAYKALGLSKEIMEHQQQEFIARFRYKAVQVAFALLAKNEMNANIETQQYNNPANLEALKQAIADLHRRFETADILLAKGLAMQANGRPDEVRSLRDYIYSHAVLVPYPGGGERLVTGHAEKEVDAGRMIWREKRAENNPYLAAYYDMEKSTDQQLIGVALRFPIITYPELNLRAKAAELQAMPNDSLKQKLQGYIGKAGESGVLDSIRNTWNNLRANPELVWELPPVIEATRLELGIAKGTGAALALDEQLEAHKDAAFWKSMGMAALSVGAGLLAIASGPVGWAALAGSIMLGGIDAYNTYKETAFKRDAYNAAMDPAYSLSAENPSYFWFAVSLAGLGMDIHGAVKVVRNLKAGAKATEEILAAMDGQKQELQQLIKEGKAAPTAQEELRQLEAARQQVEKGAFAHQVQLLEPLAGDAAAMEFMLRAMHHPQQITAFTRLAERGGKDLAIKAAQFYMAQGKDMLPYLPELVQLMENSSLYAIRELVDVVFMERGVQQALLETGDAFRLANEFDAWTKLAERGAFTAHLQQLGLGANAGKGATIAEKLGAAVANAAPEQLNRQLLQLAEPQLMAALNDGSLKPGVSAILQDILKGDHVGVVVDFERAQRRVAGQLSALATTVKTPQDFVAVMKLLQSKDGMVSFTSGLADFLSANHYMRLLADIHLQKNPIPAAVWEDLLKIGDMTDEGTIIRLINDTEFRKVLVANPRAARALKKCASPCFPPEATPAQVLRIADILKDKSEVEIAKIAEYIYQNRATAKQLDEAILAMQENFADAVKGIKSPMEGIPAAYQHEAGRIATITNKGMSRSLLIRILDRTQQANIPSLDVSKMLGHIYNAVNIEKKMPGKNLGKIMEGLTNENEEIFAVSWQLLDEIYRYGTPRATDEFVGKFFGLERAEFLLDIFTVKELADLSARFRKTDFLRSMYEVFKRANINAEEFKSLVELAVEGEESILRLQDILFQVRKPGVLTYEEARAAVLYANNYATQLKKVAGTSEEYPALVRKIWGENAVIENGKLKVDPGFHGDLEESGSKAYAQVVGAGYVFADDLAVKYVLNGAEIDEFKWALIRKIVNDAEGVSSSIKNNIIGAMWNRVNLAKFRKQFPAAEIYTEVAFRVGKGKAASADALILDGDTIIIVEFKSMAGKREREQKIIYDMMENNRFDELTLTKNKKLSEMYAKPTTKKVFVEIRDSGLLPGFNPGAAPVKN